MTSLSKWMRCCSALLVPSQSVHGKYFTVLCINKVLYYTLVDLLFASFHPVFRRLLLLAASLGVLRGCAF